MSDVISDLKKTVRSIERKTSDLDELRARRNRLIFQACESGRTEREVAEVAKVSYGFVGRLHRQGGVASK